MYIGRRIKELRQARKMKLVELCQKSGVQMATLSRIEHLKMTGTIDSHMAIAKALGVELTDLYKDIVTEEQKAQMGTPRKVMDYFVHNEKAAQEILTTNVLNKKMMPVLLKIEPGGRTNKEEYQPGTEKFIFVLEGKVEVKVGKDTFILSKGNTLYLDASLEHVFTNAGKFLAKVLCVGTPAYL